VVAECKVCEAPLDDHDISAAGMENICYQCWDERYQKEQEDKDAK